jgi:hypothetical protein
MSEHSRWKIAKPLVLRHPRHAFLLVAADIVGTQFRHHPVRCGRGLRPRIMKRIPKIRPILAHWFDDSNSDRPEDVTLAPAGLTVCAFSLPLPTA